MKTLIDFGQMQAVVKNFLKTLIFVLAGVFLYRVHNQNLIERKNLDLRGLLSLVRLNAGKNLFVLPITWLFRFQKEKPFLGVFLWMEKKFIVFFQERKSISVSFGVPGGRET